MKLLVILILFFPLASTINGQPEEVEIFLIVEEEPRFPGCEDNKITKKEDIEKCAQANLSDYIKHNLEYPTEDLNSFNEGSCLVKFIVHEDGHVSDTKVLESTNYSFAQATYKLVRSFNEMDNKWRPGYNNGAPVKTYYSLPVGFKLSNQGKQKAFCNIIQNYRNNLYNIDEVTTSPKFGKCIRRKQTKDQSYQCSMDELEAYIVDNMQYPNDAFDKGIEDNVTVHFDISIYGNIKNVRASGLYKTLNDEARELIEHLNHKDYKWEPGRLDGKKVNTRLSVFVNFVLDEWE